MEAVDHPAGGNNHAVALDIAEKHKSRTCYINEASLIIKIQQIVTESKLDVSQTKEEHTVSHNANPVLIAVPKKGQEISTAFANMYRNVSRHLGKSVDVEDLKEFLHFFCNPKSLRQRCIDPVIFKEATSTKDVLKKLCPEYVNPIELFILEGIVEAFDSSQCKRLLNEYKESYF